MNQTVILGNFITMDEKRPFAKAALVKNGVFAYIGDAAEAKKLADDTSAQILNYGCDVKPLEKNCSAMCPNQSFR